MECFVLQRYGTVERWSVDPTSNPWDDSVAQYDLLKDEPEGEFDLGLFHPVCSKWAGPTGISGDRDDHPNMIPRARELAERHCGHWIIENVPDAPLDGPVVLDGRQFGLPIAYQRAFETSFDVTEPPRYGPIGGVETSPHYHSERSREWWGDGQGLPVGRGRAEGTHRQELPPDRLSRARPSGVAGRDRPLGRTGAELRRLPRRDARKARSREQPPVGGLRMTDQSASETESYHEVPAHKNTRPTCDVCGAELGAGYLCDDCDKLEVER